MLRWSALSLVLLVGLVGCSAGPLGEPTPQEKPAPVKLVNNATITETFEVAVVDVGSNLTVTRGGDESVNYTVDQGSTTIQNPEVNRFTAATFPDSARIHGRYTLEPGESQLLSIENVAPDETVVVPVYDESEGTYRAIKSLGCGGAILGYEVSPEPGSPDDWTPSVHQCG